MGDAKSGVFSLFFKFLLLTFLDLFGISLFPVFISIIYSDDSMHTSIFGRSINQELFFIFFCSIFVIKSFFTIYVQNSILLYCEGVLVNLRVRLIEGYLGLPYDIFASKNSSFFINSTVLMAAKFSNGVLLNLAKLFSEILVSVTLFLYLIYSQGLFILVPILIIGLLSFIYLYILRPKIVSYGDISNNASQAMVKIINETLYGYKDIQILNLYKYFLNKFIIFGNKYKKAVSNANIILISPRYIIESILIVSFLIFFYTNDSNNIELLVSSIGIIVLCGLRLLPSYNVIQSCILQLGMNATIINELATCLSSPIKLKLDNDIKSVISFDYINIENIYFRYDRCDSYLFNNLSIKIRKGSINVIDGSSGVGKSTLVNLITGLLEPSQGKISLIKNGDVIGGPNDIRSISMYLPQETFVIHDSILENITFKSGFESEEDLQRVWYACENAGIADFIRSLPLGLHTNIGDRGFQISGGQKQRIALARAFYFGRSLLILDESTSALDVKTENLILKNLLDFKGDMTIILITHRSSILHDFSSRICL